jgi:hypothetical protein
MATTIVEKAVIKNSVISKPVTEDVIIKMRDKALAENINKASFVYDSLNKYAADMGLNKSIKPEDGVKNQLILYRVIKLILDIKDEKEFNIMWNMLLAFFRFNRNEAFSDRSIFRFAEYWKDSVNNLTTFQRLLNLIRLTCDPEKRSENLKRLNMAKTLELGLDDEQRRKVITFYST